MKIISINHTTFAQTYVLTINFVALRVPIAQLSPFLWINHFWVYSVVYMQMVPFEIVNIFQCVNWPKRIAISNIISC